MPHFALFKSYLRTPWTFPLHDAVVAVLLIFMLLTQKWPPLWSSDYVSQISLNSANLRINIESAKLFGYKITKNF